MASSTAACSGMRIVRSCSFPSSLQFLCCAKLRQIIPDEKSVLKSLDVPPGLRQFLDNNLGWLLDPRFNECVLYPTLPKRSWSFALKPSSVDPLLTDVVVERDIADEEDGSRIYIGGRPFILQCGRRRLVTPQLNPPSVPQLSSPLPEFRACGEARLAMTPDSFEAELRAYSGEKGNVDDSFETVHVCPSLSGTSAAAAQSTSYSKILSEDIYGETSGSASYGVHSAEFQRRYSKDFLNEMETESTSHDLHNSDYQKGLLKDFLIEPDASMNYDSMDSLEILTDEEEEASPAKRRRSSYNYIMGLSDPDSENETAESV